jgi:hypothetical protein
VWGELLAHSTGLLEHLTGLLYHLACGAHQQQE